MAAGDHGARAGAARLRARKMGWGAIVRVVASSEIVFAVEEGERPDWTVRTVTAHSLLDKVRISG